MTTYTNETLWPSRRTDRYAQWFAGKPFDVPLVLSPDMDRAYTTDRKELTIELIGDNRYAIKDEGETLLTLFHNKDRVSKAGKTYTNVVLSLPRDSEADALFDMMDACAPQAPQAPKAPDLPKGGDIPF